MIDVRAVFVLAVLFLVPAAAAQAPDGVPASSRSPTVIEIASSGPVGPPVDLPAAAEEAREQVERNVSAAESSITDLSRLQREIGSLPPFLRNRVMLQQEVEQSNRSLARARQALKNAPVGDNRTNVSERLREAHLNALQARQTAEKGMENARVQLDRVLERNISTAREALQQARDRLERLEGRLGEERLQSARQALEAAEANISAAESEREELNKTANTTELVASTQSAASSIRKATQDLQATETLLSEAAGHPPVLNVLIAVASAGTVFGFLYYRIRRRDDEEEVTDDGDEE